VHDRSGRASAVFIYNPDWMRRGLSRRPCGTPFDAPTSALPIHWPKPSIGGRGANDDVSKPVGTALLLRLISMYRYVLLEAGTFEAASQS